MANWNFDSKGGGSNKVSLIISLGVARLEDGINNWKNGRKGEKAKPPISEYNEAPETRRANAARETGMNNR